VAKRLLISVTAIGDRRYRFAVPTRCRMDSAGGTVSERAERL